MAADSTTDSIARLTPSFFTIARAMAFAAPDSSITLPNTAPSRKNGK